MNTIGLILARGGSRAISRKNLKKLGGKPLIAWTIEAAFQSKVCEAVYVTTEDDEIAEVSEFWGAVVLPRPQCLAEDEVQSAEVCRFALRQLVGERGIKPETVVILPPTSPFRTGLDIRQAYDLHEQHHHFGTVIAVRENHKYHWRVNPRIESADIPPENRLGRQWNNTNDWLYEEAGALYIVDVKRFLETGKYILPPYILYKMQHECIEIDTPLDFWMAERMLEHKGQANAKIP